MRHSTLTPREEDRILRHAERVDVQLVRVECLRYTVPLLKKAGISAPRPFHRYLVKIRYRDDEPRLEVVPPQSYKKVS